MTNSIRLTGVLVALVLGVAGCEGTATTPTAPTPLPAQDPNSPQLVVFRDSGSGFATSDTRDSQEQIVQFTTSGELMWTPDGTRLPGFQVLPFRYPGAAYISGNICPEGCAFEVRFGTRDGEKRAYLTVNYGHWNEGHVVDVEVRNGALVVTPTTLFPPGTFTLSGRVTEMTPTGPAPLAGASVARMMSDGWQWVETDRAGMYTIYGMYNGTSTVSVIKEGYQSTQLQVTITGDTRFDAELLRQ